MVNIPTDLLRTLVAVVDMRSFTKAANSLGVTQPAVSAQIKRLQFLLGYELLDKSAPGVALTPQGQEVVTAARRILTINDELLRSSGNARTHTLRIGIPGDFAGARIAPVLANFLKRWPNIGFNVAPTSFERTVRELSSGELDLAVGTTNSPPPIKPRHSWLDHPVWVRSEATRVDPLGPVPLISFGEDCMCYRAAVQALSQVGRECELVFSTRGIVSLEAAAVAGLGVLVLPLTLADQTSLSVWTDAPLPRLPQIHCGVFVAEGESRPELLALADDIAAALRPKPVLAEGVA